MNNIRDAHERNHTRLLDTDILKPKMNIKRFLQLSHHQRRDNRL